MSFAKFSSDLIDAVNATFGSGMTYHYENSDPSSTITGVFENAWMEVNGVSTKKPIVKNVKLSQLTKDPVEGDTLTIESTSYRIVDHEPDGLGTTILILEKI